MIPHDTIFWLMTSTRFESSGSQALVSWTLIICKGLLLVEVMHFFSLLELLYILIDESKFDPLEIHKHKLYCGQASLPNANPQSWYRKQFT